MRCGRDARGAGDSSPGAPGAAERSSAGRAPVGRAGSGCRDRRCRDSGGSEALTYSRGSIAAAALETPRVNNRAGRGTTAPGRPRGRDDVTSSAAALPFGPRSPRRKARRELQSRRPPRAVRSPFAAAAAAAAAMIRARQLLRLAALPPPRARSYADAAAGPAAMAFTFASPTQVFYNGTTVKQVDVPTLTGSFGILASHVPTLQVLKPGVVTVYAEDGTATKYFVSSGSVTVNADSTVQVLAEEAVTMDMLDLATAKSNLEKAVSEMAAASDEAARAEAQIKVEANEALVKALE
ncbi:ATP synthase subunit delta, mitochondrial isoform X2 [Gallus gallus]|nr:ATP synthase subunit delta, mitochondrial isoform X2 [Gallus gallus]